MEKILLAPPWAQILLLVPMGAVILAAAITDWRHRKIYNKLTYPFLIAAPILNGIAFGWSSLGAGLITAFVVILLGLPLMLFRWLGGGDIKLLAGVGALLGPGPLFHFFFYSLVLGLVMGISLSLVNGYFPEMIRRVGRFFRSLFVSMLTRTNVTEKVKPDERAYLPFAIPMFGAFLLATSDVFFQWPLFLHWVQNSMQALGS